MNYIRMGEGLQHGIIHAAALILSKYEFSK